MTAKEVAADILTRCWQNPADPKDRLPFAGLDAEIEKAVSDAEQRGRIAAVVDTLAILSDEQRLEIFGRYCRACGSKDPRCQCANDE